MKTAICYFSEHHGNTLKVLERLAEEFDIDLIDVRSRVAVHLEMYDMIGFASGIYYGRFHETVTDFAKQYLPEGKKVFFVYTCGAPRKGYTAAAAEAVADKKAEILGKFQCKGFDTFGPFKLIGGIAKNHPNEDDVLAAIEFYKSISE